MILDLILLNELVQQDQLSRGLQHLCEKVSIRLTVLGELLLNSFEKIKMVTALSQLDVDIG